MDTNSYWIDSTKDDFRSFSSLDTDINVDVCIVGGGITGISCGYYLAKSGLKVAILEKDLLAYKTTGNTTAKITSQHGLFYKYLIDSFSVDFAKLYLEANQNAIQNIKSIIDDENIDCDFEKQDSYIFTQDEKEVDIIKKEVDAVNLLDFPADFVTDITLPIDILAAIKFPNQAQFHPRKYLIGLINSILKNSGELYENSKVVDIKKDNGLYTTYTDIRQG